MKKNYSKKLAQYSTLATGLVAISNSSNAQILVNDFNDVVLSQTGNSSFEIDLDNNNVNDMKFEMSRGSFGYCSTFCSYYSFTDLTVSGISPIDRIQPVVNQNASKVELFNFSNNIDGSYDFDNTPPVYFFNAYTGTNDSYQNMSDANASWPANTNDGYMAFRFINGANTHYGWVQISISSTYTATIKAAAIQLTPLADLTAGQLVSSIFNSTGEESKVVLKDQSLLLNDMTLPGSVSMMNASGQEVMTEDVSPGNNAFSTAGFTPGIYLVRVNLNEKVIIKKVAVN